MTLPHNGHIHIQSDSRGEVLIFRPRPSIGWLSLIALALAILVGTGWVALEPDRIPLPILALNLAIAIGLGLPFLALAAMWRTMRYELDDHSLDLRYGPVLRYYIPLSEIRSVRRRNLAISLWSSIRMPGVALFSVPYSDVGEVRMCATAAANRVLLIETARAKYGVTPAEEDEFVTALHARLGSD